MEELKSQLKTRKNNKAFTLAELVVVIVILAIITSISFISISNYAAATRDIKRLNDITELYKKIILEKEKESDLEGLVINPETRQVMIGGRLQDVTVGTINFQVLRENALDFRPPREGEEYLIAIARGAYTDSLTGEEREYSFLQLKAEKEATDGYFIVGNYRIIDKDDSVDLFTIVEINSCYIENGIGEQVGEGPCVIKSCNPNHIINGNTCEPVWFKTTWRVGTTGYGDGTNIVTFGIEIPANSIAVVDWGDGVIRNFTGATSASTMNITHTYDTGAGDYQVKIQNITRFYNSSGSSNLFGKLISVDDWGNIAWSRMDNMFNRANKLVSLPTTAPNISNVTNMSNMFAYATLFNSDVSSWDVSGVTDMSYMFQFATSFNNGGQPVLNWNTGNVKTMIYMFEDTKAFNSNISSWNTGNVTDMKVMFRNAKAFNGYIGNWNVGSVTDMQYMFYGATAFNNGGEQALNWNTGNVKNMSNMFNTASLFNSDISSWNTGNVTTMTYMFSSATAFNNGGQALLWGTGTSNVINMGNMFASASSFNQDVGNWDTSSVGDMSNMFSRASVFNQNVGNWDTSGVTVMNGMFYYAYAFNNGGQAFNWNTGLVTNMNNMFQNATVFNQDISHWCVTNISTLPTSFVSSSPLASQTAKIPVWGTCPTP